MPFKPHPTCDLAQRALTMWPRLDRRALSRCGGDVSRITRLVSRRTALSPQAIRAMLLGQAGRDAEGGQG